MPLDLKSTINLPKTSFPMKANLPQNEPKILERWEKIDLYGKVREARKGAREYVLHDGPPYANGPIHLGHALNKCLKDFVVKSKNMAGWNAPYIPGWDCHGLPIEIKVDQQLGGKKLEMQAIEVRLECRKYAQKYLDLQRQQFQRLGIIGRFEKPYSTMASEYESVVLDTFYKFFETGFVYKGLRPVYWCWHDRTALAEAEVEYEVHTSPAVFVRYKLQSDPRTIDAGPQKWEQAKQILTEAGVEEHRAAAARARAEKLGSNSLSAVELALEEAGIQVPEETVEKIRAAVVEKEGGNPLAETRIHANKPIYTIIWTTTPWTLPASLAVAFHPDEEYVALEASDAIYIVSEKLAKNVAETCGFPDAKSIARFAGRAMDKTWFYHPFLPWERRKILGVLADYVTMDTGTGVVHTAPAHGAEDFSTGQRYKLEATCDVNAAGRLENGLPEYDGLQVFKANQPIIELLKSRGALLHADKVEHSYPHCWRCHNPVIFRATEQWFISMETPMPGGGTFRSRALEEIEKVHWDPSWGEERISNMVETRPDWCISRQRVWGVPIAVFVCTSCKKPLNDPTVNRRVVDLFAKSGADSWYTPAADALATGVQCPCGGSSLLKEADILDVWFESGCSYLVETAKEANYPWPSDLYLEGGDQYRGWFMSSLLCALAARGTAPYKSVATPGWTLDEQGRALSKSRGNDVDPADIARRLGAEIVRLWVASVDFREDVVGSENLMQRIAENYKKIRNTFRYILGNLYDFDPAANAVEFSQLQALDQYMLRQTADMTRDVLRWYEEFEFHKIYQRVNNFCVVELSAFYFDVLKDRLYTAAPNARARRSAQTVIWKIAETLVRLLTPIMSFTCDEVWNLLPSTEGRAESVHLSTFLSPEEILRGAGEQAARESGEWETLHQVRDQVLKALEDARNAKLIGANLEAQVKLMASDSLYPVLERHQDDLRYLFIVSSVVVERSASGNGTGGLAVEVGKAPGEKCERCWNYSTQVGKDPSYPTVCERCSAVLRELENGGDRASS